jgi:TRAP-type C4-dicarboxylate transport system permease large subunit
VYLVETYVAYLVISIGLTIWVARTLHKNGRIFLVDAFLGNEKLADSVNHLLVVGFYLINIGFVAFALKESARPKDLAESIEVLSTKVGLVLLVLGVMHFFNLYVFTKLRKRAMLRHLPPPVSPQERIAVPHVPRPPAPTPPPPGALPQGGLAR